MEQALLTPLNQLEASLNSLLSSLTTTNTYTSAPAAAQSLLNADDALSQALADLKKHQENYARILTLRAEADRLQTQLRDIVRTCVDLRNEVGEIHPSILHDDTDEEDEQEDEISENRVKQEPTTPQKSLKSSTKQHNPIDYDTLLSFAARIGKHNAAAAIEAERQSNRIQPTRTPTEPSQPSRPHTQPETNGTNTQTASTDTPQPPADKNTETLESQAELALINDTLATQRAARGMAFPINEALRLGALGRLQYIREQGGEDAVDAEVERLIKQSEGERLVESDRGGVQAPVVVEVVVKDEPAPQQQQQQRPPPLTLPPGPASLPPKPKIALDLDFPGSDDEDDDP